MVMEQRDGYQINLACECGDERHEWYTDDVHPHWIIRPGTWIASNEGALDLGIVRGSAPGKFNNLDVFFEEFTSVTEFGCASIQWAPGAPDEEP
jgi:hypothetical protein